MNRKSVLVAAATVIVTTAAVIVAIVGSSSDPKGASAPVGIGDAAPPFTMAGIDSHQVSLRSTHGSPTIVTFGASWCHPCREEYPRLQRAAMQHPELKILGVDEDDLPSAMRDFMRNVGASWPVGTDTVGSVRARYGVTGLPEIYFIARDGTIRGHIRGDLSTATLTTEVAKILQ